jgi:beta-lactam-binding protein with PASTA domain
LLVLAGLLVLAVGAGALFATGVVPRTTPREAVPSVVGQTAVSAAGTLAGVHLRYAVTQRSYDNRVAAGLVLAQRPAGGRVKRGTVVSVTVSLGLPPVAVPSLAGKTQAAASAALLAGHLAGGSVTQQASTTVPAGSVISWSPYATTVAQGTRVNLVISSGLPIVAVPQLTGTSGASFAAAQHALAVLGLVATESEAYNNTVAKGQVVSSAPVPGTKVRIHTAVNLVISKGPDTTPVPNVYDLSVSGATTQLVNYGLSVSGVQGNPTNTVTGTNPSQGTVVTFGTSVEILTS